LNVEQAMWSRPL